MKELNNIGMSIQKKAKVIACDQENQLWDEGVFGQKNQICSFYLK